MSITTFGIFQRKKALTNKQYNDLSANIISELNTLIAQLPANGLDVQSNVHNRRAQGVDRDIQTAKIQLEQIVTALKNGPIQSEPFDNTKASRRNNHHEQSRRNAEFLENKMQGVVKVYNGLVQSPHFTQGVRNLFADFFTKIADIFRDKMGARVKGTWAQSQAQKNLSGQFNSVYENILIAKKTAAAKPAAYQDRAVEMDMMDRPEENRMDPLFTADRYKSFN